MSGTKARHTLDCDMVQHPNCTRCNCGSAESPAVDPDKRLKRFINTLIVIVVVVAALAAV